MCRRNTTTLIVFLLIGCGGGGPRGPRSGLNTRGPPRPGADPRPRHRQVGSLAGVAHLSNDNAGVLR